MRSGLGAGCECIGVGFLKAIVPVVQVLGRGGEGCKRRHRTIVSVEQIYGRGGGWGSNEAIVPVGQGYGWFRERSNSFVSPQTLQ